MSFVHLHCHSDYSLLDGCAAIDNLMKRASEFKMPALALTDHGNLFGAYDFFKTAKAANIKPLLGCEIYLVIDHAMTEKSIRSRDPDAEGMESAGAGLQGKIYHMGLLAATAQGYANLSRLVSKAHLEGMYYKPRVDFPTLAAHAEGLIGFSGCLQGVVPQHLILGDEEKARQWMGRFVDIFGRERFIVELMNHGLDQQNLIEKPLLKLAREFGLKSVCTNDVHYVRRADSVPQDLLLCIQTGKKVADAPRLKFPNDLFYLKSGEEMEAIFGERPDLLSNTLEVAEMCQVEIVTGRNHYPIFNRPVELKRPLDPAGFDRILELYAAEKNKILAHQGKELMTIGETEREALRQNGIPLFSLCKEGLFRRYGVDYDNLTAWRPEPGQEPDFAEKLCRRMDYELAIITGAGFVDYFLIVSDFINWARRQKIPVGPGRGSGAGSVVAYILGITNIDPLRFRLLFERMLNLERVSPPDFDIDFCQRRRDEVIEYVRNVYGRNNVANIITFGTFGAKSVIKDIARVMDYSYTDASRITKMIPDGINPDTKHAWTLDGALGKIPELAAELEKNPTLKTIFEYGRVIEGMTRNTGTHAAGIIICDQPVTEYVPATLQEKALTTQFPKGPVEDLGLLKMDFLGLKNLTVIDDAAKLIRETVEPSFSIEDVPWDEPRTFRMLNEARTIGVFQMESSGMQTLCRQFNLSSIDEIVALIALYRPGPMDMIPDYIKGKRDPASIQYPHPLLEGLLRETYGVMVYQEQVMEAAKIVAGFTLGQADLLRRAMGKKKVEEMAKQRAIFCAGARQTSGLDEATASDLFNKLEKFAAYGFNKSHSAAYGLVSYQTAYLKANYPVQYMAAALSNELGDSRTLAKFLEECQNLGCPVLGPDINQSGLAFTPVITQPPSAGRPDLPPGGMGSILFGLSAIKGVGAVAAGKIIEERQSGGPFRDFSDFAGRIGARSINRRDIENLVKTGAFDRTGGDRGWLLANLDRLLKEASAKQRDRERGQSSLFDLLETSGNGPSPARETAREGVTLTISQRLQFERELLGFYISGHPLDEWLGLAEALNTFKGEEYRKLEDRATYRLAGVIQTIEKKISKKDSRPWAVVHLDAREDSYSINYYADAFETAAPWMAAGAIVAVTGSVQVRDQETILAGDTIAPLDLTIERAVKRITWILRHNALAMGFLEALRQAVDDRSGETVIRLGFRFGDRDVLMLQTSEALRWQVGGTSFQTLRRHPAVEQVLVEARPPVPVKRDPPWKKRQGRG